MSFLMFLPESLGASSPPLLRGNPVGRFPPANKALNWEHKHIRDTAADTKVAILHHPALLAQSEMIWYGSPQLFRLHSFSTCCIRLFQYGGVVKLLLRESTNTLVWDLDADK